MLPVAAHLAAGTWHLLTKLLATYHFRKQNLAKCFAINFRAVSVINLPLQGSFRVLHVAWHTSWHRECLDFCSGAKLIKIPATAATLGACQVGVFDTINQRRFLCLDPLQIQLIFYIFILCRKWNTFKHVKFKQFSVLELSQIILFYLLNFWLREIKIAIETNSCSDISRGVHTIFTQHWWQLFFEINL